MSSASTFVSPFSSKGASLFAPSSTVSASRKRKRRPSRVSAASELDVDALPPARGDEKQQWSEQRSLAGLSLGDHIPRGKFPRAATSMDWTLGLTDDDLEPTDERSELSETSETSEPSETVQEISMKRQHLAVLTTIMHKCLLDGDYVRAGRAWGNLLRAETMGKPMNMRKNHMWGVGAEILLRRYSPRWIKRAEDTAEPSTTEPISRPISTFSREGFERAKDYYERLILQYPYRPWLANVVSVLHFYPAMLGLWIYQVQSEQKAALAAVMEAQHQNPDGVESSSSSSDLDEKKERHHIRKRSLREAEQIADRLDDLLSSLPYSEDPGLWRLRAMVALWLRDLCATNCDSESSDRESTPSKSRFLDETRILDSMDQQSAETVLVAHDKKAQQAFEKAGALRASAAARTMNEEPKLDQAGMSALHHRHGIARPELGPQATGSQDMEAMFAAPR